MTVTKLITAEKTLSYLQQEKRDALREAGIRTLNDYAWKDCNDPDYVGLAKWSLEPSWEQEAQSFNRETFRVQPPERAKELARIAEDFEGLMDSAYDVIGLALFYEKITAIKLSVCNVTFWSQQIAAVSLLSMASERLRDFFIHTYFNQTAKRYNRQKTGQHPSLDGLEIHYYQAPFLHALKLNSSNGTTELQVLHEIAPRVHEFRKWRNEIVHERALEAAEFGKNPARNRYGDKASGGDDSVERPYQEKIDDAIAAYRKGMRDAMKGAIEWYKLLVKMADNIFNIEYRLRS